MRTLVIDSATEACSVALFEDGALLAGECRRLGRGHAEQLVPMIAALPAKGRAERIVASLGPGSFTGLRVGLAAARALALVWGSEVMGYPTLALVAAMARARRGDAPICVAMTGGHGEWFVAGYGPGGEELRPCLGLPPESAAKAPEALVAGSQAEALVAARGFGEALPQWPDAREFALLDPAMLGTAELRYGRPPDARLPGGATP
jgi:tRNA threonylcarbamoyl adenosine modification protein YeaZ